MVPTDCSWTAENHIPKNVVNTENEGKKIN